MTGRDGIEALIAETALGNADAFSTLYDKTSSKLFGVCLSVLGHRGESEEVLQEVFISVWQNAGRYAVTGHSPMTWLITIARNRAIDRLRARKSRPAVSVELPEMPDKAPTPEGVAIARSEAARIQHCFEQLEQVSAAAVRGAYLEGQSYKELAARFNVPLNTMRTWLRRSLLALRECLNP